MKTDGNDSYSLFRDINIAAAFDFIQLFVPQSKALSQSCREVTSEHMRVVRASSYMADISDLIKNMSLLRKMLIGPC